MYAPSAGYSSALDIPTLLFFATTIVALLGLFLIISWLQDRSMRALAWWGAAYLIGASSMALWSSPAPLLPVPAEVFSALIFVACGMIWNGVRLFHGRRVLPLATFAGAILWVILCQAPVFATGESLRIVLAAMIASAYAFFTAFELWRERRKSLHSRSAAVIVPLLHAAIFLIPIALRALSPETRGAVFASGWFELFALETMLYGVGTGVIVLLLVKDYHVHVHKNAASTDHLTGLFNRRAFLDGAQSLCAHQAGQRQPVTVLMFDLDHFKSINDRFGHAAGDDVLRLFAANARANMRASDLIGRLGGEEFAAIVPGTCDTAVKIAERIRAGFEMAAVEIPIGRIGTTVSIGAACSLDPVMDVGMLLARADAALYRAKEAGRNRIYTAEETPEPTTAERLIAAARAGNAALEHERECAIEAQPDRDHRSAA